MDNSIKFLFLFPLGLQINLFLLRRRLRPRRVLFYFQIKNIINFIDYFTCTFIDTRQLLDAEEIHFLTYCNLLNLYLILLQNIPLITKNSFQCKKRAIIIDDF